MRLACDAPPQHAVSLLKPAHSAQDSGPGQKTLEAEVEHAHVTQGGVGEVEFGTAADALRAISQLSNSTLDGQVITVRCAPTGPAQGYAASSDHCVV